jgi:hypothetical protein
MGARERWIFLGDDGQLMMREENDGPVFLRRGAEAVEWPITLDEIKSTYPAHYEYALELMKRRDAK